MAKTPGETMSRHEEIKPLTEEGWVRIMDEAVDEMASERRVGKWEKKELMAYLRVARKYAAFRSCRLQGLSSPKAPRKR